MTEADSTANQNKLAELAKQYTAKTTPPIYRGFLESLKPEKKAA